MLDIMAKRVMLLQCPVTLWIWCLECTLWNYLSFLGSLCTKLSALSMWRWKKQLFLFTSSMFQRCRNLVQKLLAFVRYPSHTSECFCRQFLFALKHLHCVTYISQHATYIPLRNLCRAGNSCWDTDEECALKKLKKLQYKNVNEYEILKYGGGF